jgi:hypothetical protein
VISPARHKPATVELGAGTRGALAEILTQIPLAQQRLFGVLEASGWPEDLPFKLVIGAASVVTPDGVGVPLQEDSNGSH